MFPISSFLDKGLGWLIFYLGFTGKVKMNKGFLFLILQNSHRIQCRTASCSEFTTKSNSISMNIIGQDKKSAESLSLKKTWIEPTLILLSVGLETLAGGTAGGDAGPSPSTS